MSLNSKSLLGCIYDVFCKINIISFVTMKQCSNCRAVVVLNRVKEIITYCLYFVFWSANIRFFAFVGYAAAHRLTKRGYESLFSYYEKVSPQLNEPLYTRPAWPALRYRRVQWFERRSSLALASEVVYSIVGSISHLQPCIFNYEI